MEKQRSLLETLAILAAIFMMAWTIRGDISANTAAIAELRGALLAHNGGHSHVSSVVIDDSKAEAIK